MKYVHISLCFLVRFQAQANHVIYNLVPNDHHESENFNTGIENELMNFERNRTMLVECNQFRQPDFYHEEMFIDRTFEGIYHGDTNDGKQAIDAFASQKCKTSESNPKLKYTSKDMCTFKFHSIPDQEDIPDGYLSSACSDKNVVEKMKPYMIDDPPQEKIVSWPDVCVGDFQRCYDVKRDRTILLPHMCKSDTTVLKKDLPLGTTHVSVDCREDKKKQIELMKEFYSKLSKGTSSYMKQHDSQTHEFYAFIFAILMLVAICVGLCLMLVHRYAFKPYLKAMKRTSSDLQLDGNSELVPIRSRSKIGDSLL